MTLPWSFGISHFVKPCGSLEGDHSTFTKLQSVITETRVRYENENVLNQEGTPNELSHVYRYVFATEREILNGKFVTNPIFIH